MSEFRNKREGWYYRNYKRHIRNTKRKAIRGKQFGKKPPTTDRAWIAIHQRNN